MGRIRDTPTINQMNPKIRGMVLRKKMAYRITEAAVAWNLITVSMLWGKKRVTLEEADQRK